MRNSIHSLVCPLLISAALASTAGAAAPNLLINGNFTTVTNNMTATGSTFGQFGDDTNSTLATGSVLTVGNWATQGYNFVYSAATVDQGKQTSGANANQPSEAPDQGSTNGSAGDTYMYGLNNGGLKAFSTSLFTGNFLAADAQYETGSITQAVSGLTVGATYNLSFFWGGAQQQGTNFTMGTTENWTVNLGSNTSTSYTTPTVTVANKDFSGWQTQTHSFVASAQSETLSFLAGGTPTGQPPFVLLGGVSLSQVPEPSSWMIFLGLGAVLTTVGIVRRRRLAVDGEALDS